MCNAPVLPALLTGFLIALGPTALASPRASIRFLQGELDLTQPGADTARAAANMPIGPGDRLQTGPEGRAEVWLPDGTKLWLDDATRLDLVELEPACLLRLWHGGIVIDAATPIDPGSGERGTRIDTPAGTVTVLDRGRYRLAHGRDGLLAVVVETGLAEVSGRRTSVLVRSGEGSTLYPGEDPESPYLQNTTRRDDFALFVDERLAEAEVTLRYQGNDLVLPDPVRPYATDLVRYGDWRWYEPSATYVWTPRVAVGWQPYLDGWWSPYPDGLTWVSPEPWGFVTYHYGAWDYASSFGWFWVPGGAYSSAWVDWYLHDDYVGWCPRGSYHYRDWRGHPRYHETRVVRDRIARDYDPDRTVVVPRDRLFQGRVGDIALRPDQVKLPDRLERHERLDLRDVLRDQARTDGFRGGSLLKPSSPRTEVERAPLGTRPGATGDGEALAGGRGGVGRGRDLSPGGGGVAVAPPERQRGWLRDREDPAGEALRSSPPAQAPRVTNPFTRRLEERSRPTRSAEPDPVDRRTSPWPLRR